MLVEKKLYSKEKTDMSKSILVLITTSANLQQH